MIERVEGLKSVKSVHLVTADRRHHDSDSHDDFCGRRIATRAGEAVKHRVILPGTADEWRLLTIS